MSDKSIEESLYDAPPVRGAKANVDPEPQPQPEPQAAPEEPQEERKGEFDPRHRQDLTGLLYLGRLESSFTYAGHDFRVRTLSAGETIEAGELIKPSLGTRIEFRAWAAAQAAAGIISVDGQPLIVPLVAGAEPTLEEKYRYVLKWYEPIIQRVHHEISVLEGRAQEILEAMGKAGGRES